MVLGILEADNPWSQPEELLNKSTQRVVSRFLHAVPFENCSTKNAWKFPTQNLIDGNWSGEEDTQLVAWDFLIETFLELTPCFG